MFEIISDPYNYPFWILIISVLIGVMLIISRSFSIYIKFSYPNAKFEAIGNPYIQEKELSRFLDMNSLKEFKDQLNISKDYNIVGENSRDVQQSLDDSLIKTIRSSRKDSSKDMNDFFDAYLEKIDINLIKNQLKNKLKGEDIEYKDLERTVLQKTKELLEEIIKNDKDKIPDLLREKNFSQEVIDSYSDNKKKFLKLDIAIDKYIISKFKSIKVPHKCEKGKQRFVNVFIDINNIKNILRAKQLSYDDETCRNLFLGDGQEIAQWKFKEMTQLDSISQIISSLEGTSYYNMLKDSIELYNKDKSIYVFEKALDSIFLKQVAEISIQNYTHIGPTIRYITSKEYEIKNLKIISKGISEKLPEDMIKKLLTVEVV